MSTRFDRRMSESLTLTLGIEYQENARDALRYAGPNPDNVSMLQSVIWPDASLGQGGFFVEGIQGLGTKSRLVLGGRFDRFTADARKADLKPAGMNRSPNQLYESYYGYQATDWSASEWGGLIRFERSLKPQLTLFTGLSRSARAADTTERYLGSLSLFAGVDNVFNRAYANHLNRGNLFDPDPVRINEPGRTLWIRLAWRGGAF